MANEKWSSFPTQAAPVAGDKIVGLHSGANVQFSSLGSVMLVPSGDQTITGGYSLIVSGTGNVQASSGNLIAGSNGGVGHIFVYPPTTGLGYLEISSVDNSGNFQNSLVNSSTTGSRTWTLPDETGTIALTSNASGIVNSGTANQLAYYASSGTTLSGLASADNGLLTTNGIGIPSISNTIGADISVNGLTVGQGAFTQGTPSNLAFGYIALEANSSGTNNTAVGNGVLQSVNSSSNSSVFGYNSLISNDGDYNSSLGSNVAISLGDGSNGNYNCLFGGQVGNGGGNADSLDLLGGDYNTLMGYYASVNSYTTTGAIGIGSYSNADAATGSTIITYGPGISIGSRNYPVGFRGDGTPIPAGSANYWRMKVNDTYYNIPLITDGAALSFPASGSLLVATNGTWTPTLYGSATAGTTTYSIQQGYYYLIGKLCHITCYVAVSAATGSGDVTIGGLPFTISNQTDYYPVGAALVSSIAQPFPASTTMFSAVGVLNTSTCVFAASGASAASTNLQVANTVVRFQFSMSFITT